MKVKVHSGLQLQVLALYKKALQAAARKDSDTLHYVRERFRENAASVDRKDFVVIEYMLRKGERDLKILEHMKSAHFTKEGDNDSRESGDGQTDVSSECKELAVDADAEVLVELMAKVADPLELVEASSDTLTDASVEDEDTSAVAGEELPELEREAEALKFDVGETESTSAARVADGLLFELVDGSRGRDESPAETEPEPDEDEARALAQVAAIARSESWKTFMVFSGGGDGRARMVSLVCRFGWKSDYGNRYSAVDGIRDMVLQRNTWRRKVTLRPSTSNRRRLSCD
ncbi:hypothetical protein PF004_g24110 [Phytophthora fragariae]|uniref:Complex 1 LYR protein domain-containing protein n=1 Tax=Phytophthora fragariae TaxID=53985 RepID=A0A6G0MV54_9STRA|nr:hypothetical protein PF004_g24110 [Phytophthora fragariae]